MYNYIMDYDEEIENILSSIKKKDIRLFEEIEEKNEEIIDVLYSEFSGYENNKRNKEMAINCIKEKKYEYIDSINDIESSNIIGSFNLNYFFNLKFKYLGIFIKKLDNDKILLRTTYNNNFIKVNINNHILFKKLSSKDKVKMMLLETINNLK